MSPPNANPVPPRECHALFSNETGVVKRGQKCPCTSRDQASSAESGKDEEGGGMSTKLASGKGNGHLTSPHPGGLPEENQDGVCFELARHGGHTCHPSARRG